MQPPKPILVPGTSPVSPAISSLNAMMPAARTANALQPLQMTELATFGAAQQVKSATVADKIASIAKTSDMEMVGKMLTDTIQAARGYDIDTLQKGGGITGMFHRLASKTSALRMRFDTVDETVRRLSDQLSSRATHFRGRVRDLETMRIENRQTHDSLTPIIASIRERADWMDTNVPALDDQNPFSGQEIARWKQTVQAARLRADNLERLQFFFRQLDASIDGLELNAESLAQTLSSACTESIPALKTAFVAGVLAQEQVAGAKLADMTHDVTQAAIRRAAELQNQSMIAVATSSSRSNIDLDTFQYAQEKLINGFSEASRIRAELTTRLATEAPQLQQLSRDLSQALATS